MKKREEAQKVVANRTKWTFWIVFLILALLILLYIQFTYNSNIGLGIVLKSPGITGNPAAPSGGDDAGLGGDGGGEVESGTSGTENSPATSSSGGDSGVQSAPTNPQCSDNINNNPNKNPKPETNIAAFTLFVLNLCTRTWVIE